MVTSLFIFTRIVSNPLSNVFQKKLTGNSTRPVFIILVTYSLLSLVVLPILFQLPPIHPGPSFFLNMFLCLLLALTTGLMQLYTLYAFGVLQVGYSLALFQTSALLSVFFGYRFFREQNIVRRLLGASVMVIGAIFIVFFGKSS